MRAVEEQTILVTGATDGLGRALAEELARRSATVLLHGRNQDRLSRTVRQLRQATGNDRLRGYLADFASLAEVRRLAERVVGEQGQLDVVINNAGIGSGPPGAHREESADGHERRFAVNYLAPFLLTNLLLPLLKASAPARIVNVASAGQEAIDFDDVMLRQAYDGWRAYRQSKLAQVMFTVELAERLRADGDHGVTVTALHPATFMGTKMVMEAIGHASSRIEDGLWPTLRLAISPEVEGVSGQYFDRLREARAEDQAYDPAARRRLWRLSEQLTEITASELA